MKQIIVIGILLLCLSDIATGIHLRHELTEQRKRKENNDQDELPEVTLTDKIRSEGEKEILLLQQADTYPKFVELLKKFFGNEDGKDKTLKAEEFRKVLLEQIKTKGSEVPLTESTNEFSEKYEKEWLSAEDVSKLPIKGQLVELNVRDLRPTQKEIGLQNSLDWAITQNDANQYFNPGAKMIGSPIVTYNKTYVIDGHHRWSQLFMLNKKAKIIAYDIKPIIVNGKEEGPLSVLRRVQAIIGAYFGVIPSSSGEGTVDVYNDAKVKTVNKNENDGEEKSADLNKDVSTYLNCRFRPEGDDGENNTYCKALFNSNPVKDKRDEDTNKIIRINEGFIDSFNTLSGLNANKDKKRAKVQEKILKNIETFVGITMTADRNDKPARDIMPQTDGPKDFEKAKLTKIGTGQILKNTRGKRVTLPAILDRLRHKSLKMDIEKK